MKPTAQQQAFLGELTTGTGHITLRARAGCGKTSAILMGVDALMARPSSTEILVCAYNKAIAEEVGAKLKARGYDWRQVQASTLHALGFGLLKYAFKPDVDDKKVANIVKAEILADTMTSDVYRAYEPQILALVRYAKQAGFGFFTDVAIGNTAAWYDLADHFDVNGFDDTTSTDCVVKAAQHVYQVSARQTDVIDFDDMILLPLIKGLTVKFTKDVVFLDEAQDLSRTRQALARRFVKRGTGRMVVVGDDRQAIYGFSGADAQALNNLTRDLGAKTFPLSVTWRCPKSVVKVAQSIVPDLEAADTAPEGEVLHTYELPSDLCETDVILCRNTAPLVDIAYKLIRSGRACKVEGRSIGDSLVALAQRWKVQTTNQLRERLDTYLDRETQKAISKGNETKAAEIEDKVNTLREIIAYVNSRKMYAVSDVVKHINDLFEDGAKNVLTLATYHRSKGREWDRVILWQHGDRCPSRAARQEWQLEQESNLAYVAITRAKRVLVFCDAPTERREA